MKNGSVRIFISERELKECGLSFETLGLDNERTGALLAAILLSTDGVSETDLARLTVEALPVGGGVLFLLTPTWALPLRLKRRVRYPLIYALADADALLSLADGWRRLYPTPARFDNPLGASSLYRFGTEYRLLLYPVSPLSRPAQTLLDEWGKQVGAGDAAAAFTAEHGEALCIGDAMRRLCG